jgi:hypothetical protein
MPETSDEMMTGPRTLELAFQGQSKDVILTCTCANHQKPKEDNDGAFCSNISVSSGRYYTISEWPCTMSGKPFCAWLAEA